MDLIKIIDNKIIPDASNNLLFNFTITIPKGSYIEHMYIAPSKYVNTEGDLTDGLHDAVLGSVNVSLYYDSEECFNTAFTKISEVDNYCTYQFNNDFYWMTDNGDTSEGLLVTDEITFLTLKIDTSTEAKYKANCSESSITIPIYDKTRVLVDIADLGRLVGGCDPCKNIPESFVKTIMEYRVFEAAIETRDWLLVKRLYTDIYNTRISGSSASYSLTNKCNCNV